MLILTNHEKNAIRMKIRVRFLHFSFLLMLILPLRAFSQYDSIVFDGRNRTFLLHLPSGYTGNDPLPMIIAMHGGFGSASNLQNQSQLSVTADKENFIVVYPEGVKSPLGIRTWNAGGCCGYASLTDIDDVGFISALIDSLADRYAIDTQRVYATGMSNGGFMSYRLACELPDKIAAIAPVAASMSMVTCNPSRPVPVIHFHSYLDMNVPYQGGIGDGPSDHYNPPQDSVLSAWSEIDNCGIEKDTVVNNDEYTHTQWRNCDCSYEIHHYITRDGGHSWPGGQQTITGDPVSAYINANDLMWAFFQQYSLDCKLVTALDVSHEKRSIFTVYPNPTNGRVYIHAPKDTPVTVIDFSGKIIIKNSYKRVIDLAGKPSGLYFFLIKTEEGKQVEKVFYDPR